MGRFERPRTLKPPALPGDIYYAYKSCWPLLAGERAGRRRRDEKPCRGAAKRAWRPQITTFSLWFSKSVLRFRFPEGRTGRGKRGGHGGFGFPSEVRLREGGSKPPYRHGAAWGGARRTGPPPREAGECGPSVGADLCAVLGPARVKDAGPVEPAIGVRAEIVAQALQQVGGPPGAPEPVVIGQPR